MKQKPEKANCFISILLSAAMIMLLPPTDSDRISVEKFERFLGQGIANNWDVSKVISNFYGWFLLFTVLSVIILFALEYLLRRNPQIRESESWRSLEKSTLAAFIVILFRACAYFWRLGSFSFGYYFILSIFVMDVVFCYSGLEKRIDSEKYTLLKWVSMAVSFAAAVVYPGRWSDGQGWFLYYCFIFGILFMGCLIYEIRRKERRLPCENVIWKIGIFLSGLPFLTSVYIESVHILNQHNVFIHKPRRVYCVFLVAVLCTVILVGYLWRNRTIKWRRIVYPLLLLGLSCLSNQVPLQLGRTVNLFESANAGVLVSDFLYFGKLPLVEHYGGHMLNGVIGGILYALINQDSAGAVLLPYSEAAYVVMTLFFYFFLKELLQSEDSAFLYALCVPLHSMLEYYIWGLLVCISVGSYIRKRGYGRALLIWISCAIAVFSRLDVGTAFGIGAVAGLTVYLLKTRQARYLKELGLTFLAVIAGGLSTWSVLCVIKGCSPIGRMREFIAMSLSNQNWGTGMLGDKYSFLFAFAYMLIPLVCIILLLYFLFLMDKRWTESAAYYMIIVLGVAYFANVPRGLVRHTLNELSVKTVVFSGGVFIVAALYYVYKKQTVFASGTVILILLLSIMANNNGFKQESLIERVPMRVNKCIGGWASEWQDITERKQRVQMSETVSETIASYEKVFDLLLDEEDTFLDFMNISFLYSALGRECPVYAAQSPGHLSGEYTQEAFIRQIEERKDRIPLAILPASDSVELDGISNTSRYYKVSEYIFQTYRPLCRFQDTAVWCRTEKYDELADRLTQEYELADYGYDKGFVMYLHDYPMYDIPYLWGNYDTKSGWNNPVLAELSAGEDGRYYIGQPFYPDKSNGNYLLLICNCDNEYMEETNNAEIVLGSTEAGENNLYRFRFNLHSGEQKYLIRISADYFWYANNIDMVYLQTDEKISNVRMQILQGD